MIYHGILVMHWVPTKASLDMKRRVVAKVSALVVWQKVRMPSFWKIGHWRDEYNNNGTLKPFTISYEKLKDDLVSYGKVKLDGKESESEELNPGLALGFMCSVGSSTRIVNAQYVSVDSCVHVGPPVGDSAPYSEIGETELHIVSKELVHFPFIPCKPSEFAEYDS